MQTPLTLAAAVLLAPALPTALGDQLSLRFAEDQTIAQVWSITQKSEVSTASLSVLGQEQDIGTDSVSTRTAEFEVTDSVHEAVDGALTKFTRKFDSIESASETEGIKETETLEVKEDESTSALTGQEVLFTYDEESEEYDAVYAEGSEGQGEWLEGLRPSESYLGGLLPETAPEEGDSWDLESEFFASLLEPLGEVDVEESADEGDENGRPEGVVAINVPNADGYTDWSELEGKLKATWVKTEEKDGKRLAVIEIAVGLTGEFDLAEVLSEEAAERDSEDAYDMAVLERTFEGEITIYWDLDAGLPMGLEGELAGTTRFAADWTVSAQMKLDLSMERESTDEIILSASFEVQ